MPTPHRRMHQVNRAVWLTQVMTAVYFVHVNQQAADPRMPTGLMALSGH